MDLKKEEYVLLSCNNDIITLLDGNTDDDNIDEDIDIEMNSNKRKRKNINHKETKKKIQKRDKYNKQKSKSKSKSPKKDKNKTKNITKSKAKIKDKIKDKTSINDSNNTTNNNCINNNSNDAANIETPNELDIESIKSKYLNQRVTYNKTYNATVNEINKNRQNELIFNIVFDEDTSNCIQVKLHEIELQKTLRKTSKSFKKNDTVTVYQSSNDFVEGGIISQIYKGINNTIHVKVTFSDDDGGEQYIIVPESYLEKPIRNNNI